MKHPTRNYNWHILLTVREINSRRRAGIASYEEKLLLDNIRVALEQELYLGVERFQTVYPPFTAKQSN